MIENRKPKNPPFIINPRRLKKLRIDTGEKAWAKGIDNFIGEKKKPKWPDDKHGKDDEKSIQKAR